jgi:hypothetical protein
MTDEIDQLVDLPDQLSDVSDPDLANPFPPGYGEDLLGPDA